MHVRQFLLAPVQGGDFLEDLNAEWSDWYDLGGRWSGAFHDFSGVSESDDGNVLHVKDNISVTRQVIAQVKNEQNNTFLTYRDSLAGTPVSAANATGHVFGLPVADNEDTAKRLSETNAITSADWNKVLSANSLEEAVAVQSRGLAIYTAQKLCRVVADVWGPESSFYDTVAYTTNPHYLLESLPDIAAGKPYEGIPAENLALVVVDFHY